MRRFQENLLIALALALCGLCLYQWRGQVDQRGEIQRLNQLVYEHSLAIRDSKNSLATANHQIGRLEAQTAELKLLVKTNTQALAVKRRELTQLQTANDQSLQQIADYKKAVEALQQKLTNAYAGIQKQNESLKKLLTQRDEFVQKYNDSVKDRNDIVAKYNELVGRVEKLQEEKKAP